MKAEDLRIGNWVTHEQWNSEECRVDAHDILALTVNEKSFLNPIDLNEDWLKRLGFHKENDTRFSIRVTDFSYILTDRSAGGFKDGGYFMGIRYDDWDIDPHTVNKFTYKVQFVHQLQNLYYALTGSDLTLKE